MSDMRLYSPSGVYDGVGDDSEVMNLVYPDDPVAEGIEVIAGRVVKFMLTQKGSDVFNPDYGGTSMHYLQISPQFLPQYKLEVRRDVENCLRFLVNADMDMALDGERLHTINVLKVAYDPYNTPNRVDVYLEIVTTLGKRAVVSITPRTGS